MKKFELVQQMERFSKSGFMNRNQFAHFMGYSSPNSVDEMLCGIPRINKQYSILDLADILIATYEINKNRVQW